MRVAALYDVHGNLPALEAVLADLERDEVDVLVCGGDVVCHGSPRSDEEILTRETPEEDVQAALGDCGADVVVCGHTHVQLDRWLGDGRRLVNAGSVGMPYEGTPEARWALLGPDVELRRTAYDVDAAADAILATGFPYAQTMVEQSLRGGIGADEATAYFEARRGA